MAAGAEGPGLDISYRYDVRGQLLEERQGDDAVHYEYDASGNRLKKTGRGGECRYSYNRKNQLVLLEGAGGEKTFTYDRQGGIIREEGTSGIRIFSYDSLHRQTKTETEEGRMQESRYDAEGLHYELIENGRVTRFVYHEGEPLYEEGGDGNGQGNTKSN